MYVCSCCGESKARIYERSVSRGFGAQRKIYVDDKGKQWNGNQCPECRYLKKANAVKESRTARHKSQRKCRLCRGILTVNYFYHNGCLEKVEELRGWTENAYNGG